MLIVMDIRTPSAIKIDDSLVIPRLNKEWENGIYWLCDLKYCTFYGKMLQLQTFHSLISDITNILRFSIF